MRQTDRNIARDSDGSPSTEGAEGAAPAPKRPKGTGTTLGDFRLVKKLGEGGMGAVYEAVQVSLDRKVAIKVLSKQLADNPDFVARFHREAKLMAKIDHPNVLRCYACGEEKGVHYFAMEHVNGGSLEDWLKRLGKLDVGDALHVLIACADALRHAHELSLIHRDIKPDNVLLTLKGVVKVADLGLAKATNEDMGLTKTGTGAGTPIFMAPEQCRDAKNVDARADIYSLGCMLYCFLTGRPPFLGETVVELFEAKEKGKFPPARKFNDAVPDRLDLIIDKCLARKPEQRYQTCAELLQDLRGLGLAAAELSFLAPGGGAPRKAAAPAPAKPLAPTVALGDRPGGAKAAVPPQPPAGAKAAPARAAEPEPGQWFVSYRNRAGKEIKRRLTELQVIELIKDEHFDLQAQASRTVKGPYRLLASYPEFERAFRGRITKAQAERRTHKFQTMYEQLEQEQIRRERWRWLRNLFRGTVSYVLLAVWLVVIVGVLVGAFFLIKLVIVPLVQGWIEKFTR
jgi:serine/threonine-protein kinase